MFLIRDNQCPQRLIKTTVVLFLYVHFIKRQIFLNPTTKLTEIYILENDVDVII